MVFASSRLCTSLVLVAYLAASVFVSSAHVHEHTHSLADGHDCVTHTHAHSHDCGDHHDHEHHHDAAAPTDDGAPTPCHDDQCAACQFLLLAAAFIFDPPPVVQPLACEVSRCEDSLSLSALAPLTRHPRGPPRA